MRVAHSSIAAIAALAPLLSACGSSNGGPTPANISGSYVVDVKDEANGCNMANWTQEGAQRFLVTLTQRGTSVSGTATDVGGVSITSGGPGMNTFTGTLTGADLTMTLPGTAQGTQGSCTFTTNATVQAKFDGNMVHGTLAYTRIPVMASSSCASLQGCQSVQTLNGG